MINKIKKTQQKSQDISRVCTRCAKLCIFFQWSVDDSIHGIFCKMEQNEIILYVNFISDKPFCFCNLLQLKLLILSIDSIWPIWTPVSDLSKDTLIGRVHLYSQENADVMVSKPWVLRYSISLRLLIDDGIHKNHHNHMGTECHYGAPFVFH